MSMTIPEAHAEIRTRYDAAAAIEKRYPDGLTRDANHEDYEQVKKLLSEIDGLEAQLSGLEEADAQKRRILDNQKRLSQPVNGHVQPSGAAPGEAPAATKSFSRQFVESDEYKRLLDSGLLHNPSNHIEMGVRLDGSCSTSSPARRSSTAGPASAGRWSARTDETGSTSCSARRPSWT